MKSKETAINIMYSEQKIPNLFQFSPLSFMQHMSNFKILKVKLFKTSVTAHRSRFAGSGSVNNSKMLKCVVNDSLILSQ
jgi:hypothetical protein